MLELIKRRVWWLVHVIIRSAILDSRISFYRHFYGMTIGSGVKISLKAKLDKTHPKGIKIGEDSYIAFGATILTHDMSRNLHVDTIIGKNCFIGANSIIMPGVSIGDSVIVAAGAVVCHPVPSNCVVAGNPAVIKKSLQTGKLGIVINNEHAKKDLS